MMTTSTMVFHVTEDGEQVEHYEVTPENGAAMTVMLTPAHAKRWEEMGANVKKLGGAVQEFANDEYRPSEDPEAKPAPKRRGRPPKAKTEE